MYMYNLIYKENKKLPVLEYCIFVLFQIHSYHGDINIGLCYLPHNDKIKVTILNGRHLRHLDYDRINGKYQITYK